LSPGRKRIHRTFKKNGVELTKSLPAAGSVPPLNASIGLVRGHILVHYAVWERPVFQTSLIIANGKLRKHLYLADSEPYDISIVRRDLDDVLAKLLDGIYDEMEPDRKYNGG
jgi:hypothetical protein